MNDVLTIFKALANETRLRIINILFQRTFCVCELQDILDMSEPRVSRHLGILKDAGLVNCEKHGKWYYYSISYNKQNENIYNYLKTAFEKENVYKQDITKSNSVKQACKI